MHYRRVGSSGLSVSQIAYGNWITHGYQIDDREAAACVRAALDAGITTFDTADAYVGGEDILGRNLSGTRRASVEIMTKVFYPTGPGSNDRGLSRKHIIESAHGSLRRLKTDYIDVYQAHRFDSETPVEEVLRAFDDLTQQGKILYSGLSEWPVEKLAEAVQVSRGLGRPLVSNQVEYSMIWRVPEARIAPMCTEAGIGLLAWSPLAQGALTGKYAPGAARPTGSRAADQNGEISMRPYLGDDLLTRVQKLGPVAADIGLTLAQLALSWLLQQPGVCSVIVGASSPAQIAENASTPTAPLDPALLARIDAILGDQVKRESVRAAGP
jgi:aryl-alcohol dehydrogenase-like predicted oxidoreductase